ncbi:helix-turn-helix domain-containing protein [Clostridium brassicae]|uniref:AraC family transcriptional regulator n=1 Tax=Clostridium brassicae TaxID=2999072 RepID=A0ABT4D5S7_9CLOT|nr:AraC family transcriptional regulator [Clostridium brassicae]MCY6957645.1 AraC family transcriptional regulator [Clostridium brassicae]
MKTYRHEFIKTNDIIDIKLTFNIDPGSVVTKHFHDWIQIIYILSGSLEFFDNNKALYLEENDFVVVNPMSIHSTRNIKGNTAILLQIPVSFLKKFVPDVRKYRFKVDTKSEDKCVQKKLMHIRTILKDLFSAYEFKTEGYVFLCYSLVFELIYILIHSFSYKIDEAALLKSEKNQLRMHTIMEYVNEHYKENMTLSEIAEVVHLNKIYFSRFFKQQTGITFLEYLNTVRIEHVYRDLINTDYPIKEILEKHRFYNYKLFMRMFKHTYGCTPRELRKKYNKN